MESTPTEGEPLERLAEAKIIEYARGIVSNDILVVDLTDHAWESSMALLMFAIARDAIPPNVGAILVPVRPHLRGYWLNGAVPAVALECYLVPVEDLPGLRAHVDNMWTALHPDPE
jgi:hypothetical protein